MFYSAVQRSKVYQEYREPLNVLLKYSKKITNLIFYRWTTMKQFLLLLKPTLFAHWVTTILLK